MRTITNNKVDMKPVYRAVGCDKLLNKIINNKIKEVGWYVARTSFIFASLPDAGVAQQAAPGILLYTRPYTYSMYLRLSSCPHSA